MQTSFTAGQLRDPDTAASNAVLRTCVHCGLCTATCPTFLLLGDELDSPRGRIYLIKDMLETASPATEQVVLHIDRCLSCLSCMTTCPSGVNYMHLVDHARHVIEETYRRPWHDRMIRAVLAAVLPRPGVFRAALLGARLARPFAGLIPPAHPLGRRLRAMLALAPAALPPAQPSSGVHPAHGQRRARVALLAGCAQQVLGPEINAATIRLLTRLGVEVVVPPEAGCCGALTHHIGKRDAALASARVNIAAWTREIEAGGLDAIVINASGCGTTVKDYGFMFRTDPLGPQAERIAELCVDITEFLTRIGYAPTRPAPGGEGGLTVAYHAACSLQHGQRVTAEPKALLRAAGFTVVEPAEAHICCGSAGTYNIMQPEIAERLRARKLDHLRAVRPDLIAAGNIGCLAQLAGGGIPTVHTVELLDWMAGGPAPAAMAPAAVAPTRLPSPRGTGWRTGLVSAAIVAAVLLLATQAHAQEPQTDPNALAARLLDALKSAPTEQDAALLEAHILGLWIGAATPAVRLLLSRAEREQQAGASADAIADFAAVVVLQPDLADAWRQSGEARLAAGDTPGALADLGQSMKREPREFLALRALAQLAASHRDWKAAYAAWSRLLAFDPKTPGGEERLKELRRKALGEET